jgi:hypothetical protein
MTITINETPRQRQALQKATDAYNAANASQQGWVNLTADQYATLVFTNALNSWGTQYLKASGGSIAFSLTNAERTAIATLAGTNTEVKALVAAVKAGDIDLSDATVQTRIALLVSNGALTQARADAVFAA